ncbi:DUF998 domain-containing protein [Catellatospora citrea]|uniref:DUF998 domain-containing protein n=1 Tax=Catellatospora citrea TaxID=53366 RepID=A0A8J3NXH4_9ACTN|nr:DUF998 domain-containing protein [Catellatospora citrea]RKE10975.1 uncharacterized protein DUF998 [Catellatospora citrea]GIF96430.1 hypothetical protein Cci01nite_15240 [Catellatospora citrea]
MKALCTCGVLAGPLFVVAFLIQGVVKPGGYDALRHPVSSLALGPYGWVQTAVFGVCGLLTVAFAAGLARLAGVRRKIGAVCVGLWGVGLVGAGLFVTDPVSGYPAGTPDLLVDHSTAGTLHDLFSVLAFFSLAVATFVLAAGSGSGWAAYSVLSGLAFLGFFFLSGVGFQQDPALVDTAGLWQRLSLLAGWTWLTVLAWRARAHAAAS